jgi:exodeoxyribonuclease V gamma subunit
MALQIFYSSRTDRMVDQLVESLGQGGSDPAVERCVLLPSKPLIERVRVQLARSAGVAMGVNFVLPAAFTDLVSLRLGLPALHPSWTPEGMTWRVLELLGPLAGQHPRLAPACTDLRSRLALARDIADRFDQYMHFRPDLIKAWDQGETFNQRIKKDPHLVALFDEGLPEGTLADEAWQRELWTRLRAAVGEHPHPQARMEALEALAVRSDLSALGPVIEVLATGPLPYPLLRLLHAVAKGVDVNLRVLMPSTEYLDGIKSKVAQWSAGEDEDLEVEAHPLLAQMGRQSIEAFKGLMSLSENGQEDQYAPEDEDGRPTLLARLQDDIRGVRQPDPVERPVGERPLRSLRVHRCYGPRREVEALRDELLRAFSDLDRLQPEEVLILTPDLGLYGPLVEAILAKGAEPRLPLAMAEQSLGQSDPLFKAMAALLGLASGRGALSELTAFLDLPAVRERLGEDAADLLAGRLQASGITFGLNAEHRGRLGAGTDPSGTWRAGLDRLLAGVWLGESPAAQDQGAAPALPVSGDLGSGSTGLLQALAWCEALLRVVLEWQKDAPPLAWAARLETAFKELLDSPFSGLDSGNVLAAMERLRKAGLDHQCSLDLNAACIEDQFRAMDSDEQRRVGDVGGRIALGGFKPLRAVPCRVLAVLGLGDLAFPRRSQAPAWDLLSAKHMPGDRDPRKEDRQLFLDALLAAKDRIILTAPARSQHTDKVEPVSVCLEELQRAALASLLPAGTPKQVCYARLAEFVLEHPLQPFSPRNFMGAEPAFDSPGFALVQALAQKRLEHPFAATGAQAKAPKDLDPDLESLLKFFKDPAQAWLRALGMAPPHRQDDPSDNDDEPVDLDNLQRWQLGDQVLDHALGSAEPFFLERLAADRVLPQGALGRRAGALAMDRAQALVQALKAAAQGDPQALTYSADPAKGPLAGTVHGSADRSVHLAWTSGDLKPTYDKASGRERFDAKERLVLGCWLKACLAAAAKAPRPLVVAAFEKGTKTPLLITLPALPEAEARGGLDRLLALRARGLSQLLPFALKTSAAVVRALAAGDDPQEAAEEVWIGSDWKPGESQFPSMARAWRGQNPMEQPGFQQWQDLAVAVWKAPLEWWALARRLGQQP